MGVALGWATLFVALGLGAAPHANPEHFWTDAKERRLHQHHSLMGQVARDAMPAVVSITTVDAADPTSGHSDTAEPQKGVGSGFLIHPDGFILTCAHVIEDAVEIRVAILSASGYPEEFPARVVGRDPQTDFALLKVEAGRRLPVLSLGTARDVDVADWVVVIGSPFGLAHSVSVGVVSYKGRTEVTPNGRNGYFDYLQTDASINPGNSGGPILDIHGHVIAVANAVNVAGQGIGFAVPVDIAKAVLPDLRAHGEVRRGWMGISVEDLTPEVAEPLGLRSYAGVLVSEVVAGSPAARAGLQAGDLITQLSSARMRRAHEMRWKVATTPIGRSLSVGFQRSGRAMEVAVKLEDPPATVDRDRELVGPPDDRELGALIKDVDSAASQRAGLRAPYGALIKNLEASSPLSHAGLMQGDVVLKVNSTEIGAHSQLAEALEAAPSGEVLNLFVRRGPRTLALSFRKP